MPKEVIQCDWQVDGPFAVEVSWGIDTQVQMATVRPDGENPHGRTGVFADLDRNRINRLIKVLRKARDQAYGADE